jgi:hypothetical protein
MEDKGEAPRPVSMFIGGLAFIPLIGVVFGIIALLRGVLTSRPGGRKLALLGGGGIVFTFAIYGALFYFGFVQRGGLYDSLRAQLAQMQLNTLVQSVEFYKLQHGAYPDTLETLRASLPSDSAVFIVDPTNLKLGTEGRTFYYRAVDPDHYYLRSTGADGEPFTPDDIVPQIVPTSQGNLGLIVEPSSP